MNLHNPKVAARRERADRELVVSRILEGEQKCGRFMFGTTHCWRPARYYVENEDTRWAYCWGCLMVVLDEKLLAPDTEYEEQEQDEFKRAFHNAKKQAHDGCSGYSSKDPDGLCHSTVIATCAGWSVCGKRCARHLIACRRRHKDKITLLREIA